MRRDPLGGLPELWLVDDGGESVLVYRRSAPESPVSTWALELARGQDVTSPQLPRFARRWTSFSSPDRDWPYASSLRDT